MNRMFSANLLVLPIKLIKSCPIKCDSKSWTSKTVMILIKFDLYLLLTTRHAHICKKIHFYMSNRFRIAAEVVKLGVLS